MAATWKLVRMDESWEGGVMVIVAKKKPNIVPLESSSAAGLSEAEARRLQEQISGLVIERVPTESLKSNPGNARNHPNRQIRLIAKNIQKFGVTHPIVIDEKNMIIAGHARFGAARLLRRKHDPADEVPSLPAAEDAVTETGYLWVCGDHRLYCGSARDASSCRALMAGEKADVVFADPLHNVSAAWPVPQCDEVRDFANSASYPTSDEFIDFLQTPLANVAGNVVDGAIIFVCMACHRLDELSAATRKYFGKPRDIVVWVTATLQSLGIGFAGSKLDEESRLQRDTAVLRSASATARAVDRRHKLFLFLINQRASLVHLILMKFPTDRKSIIQQPPGRRSLHWTTNPMAVRVVRNGS